MTCAIPTFAQNKVVKGTVVDENGDPVIGATIREKNGKTGTVTDLDGNYQITVTNGEPLTVSYLGHKSVTTTGGRLQLEAGNADLDEVEIGRAHV